MTQKIFTKSSYPKNIHFSENPENIEIPPLKGLATDCATGTGLYGRFPFISFIITLIKRKVSVYDRLKIRVRKRKTKHAIFTEIQIFGLFFSLD